MKGRKYNRIKIVLAEKEMIGIWLGEMIEKSNTTVSEYINQQVQPGLKPLMQ